MPWKVSTVLAYGDTTKWTGSPLARTLSLSSNPAALACCHPSLVRWMALSGVVAYSSSLTFPSDWPCRMRQTLVGMMAAL